MLVALRAQPAMRMRHIVMWSVRLYNIFPHYLTNGKLQKKMLLNLKGVYKFNVHGSVHRKNILIYIQQDATLRSLFYLENVLHVLGGTTTYHQERKQLYLQHLVTPLLLSAASGR